MKTNTNRKKSSNKNKKVAPKSKTQNKKGRGKKVNRITIDEVIISIIISFFGLFLILTYLFNKASGNFGSEIHKGLITIFGTLTVVICIYIIIIPIVRLVKREIFTFKFILGLIVFLLFFLLLLNIPYVGMKITKTEFLNNHYGTGIIGFYTVSIAKSFIGTLGYFLIFFILGISSYFLLFTTEHEVNEKIEDISKKIDNVTEDLKIKKREKKENKKIRKEMDRERANALADRLSRSMLNREDYSSDTKKDGEDLDALTPMAKADGKRDYNGLREYLSRDEDEVTNLRNKKNQSRDINQKVFLDDDFEKTSSLEEELREIPELKSRSVKEENSDLNNDDFKVQSFNPLFDPPPGQKKLIEDMESKNVPLPESHILSSPKEMENMDVENIDNSNIFKLPPIDLLDDIVKKSGGDPMKIYEDNARLLELTLKDFGVKIQVENISVGPALTRYEAKLAPGTKVSKLLGLSEDIALALAATSVRIEAPIPGKSSVGFEIPNKNVTPVSFKEIVESPEFQNKEGNLNFALGKDITGKTIVTSLGQMPHLLIAGSTGSGKSVCLNTLINSLLFKYTPSELKFLMIDPKKVELTPYNEIPHLISPVVTEAKTAATALKWMVDEMENRYELLSKEGAKDLGSYNRKMAKTEGGVKLPYIVVIIDELADLMMAAPLDVESSICRIAQKARAAGMHLVVATQRPSVQVITGDIKSNIPTRIAFAVFSQIDARTILDSTGAEKLLGKGDMLFTVKGGKFLRIQGAYISEEEIERICIYLKQSAKPEYLKGLDELKLEEVEMEEKEENELFKDDLIKSAMEVILNSQTASISFLQRKLQIGYSRAARMIDILEENNLVGPKDGSRGREIKFSREVIESIFGENEL